MDSGNSVGLCRPRGKDRQQTLGTAYRDQYRTGHLTQHWIGMESVLFRLGNLGRALQGGNIATEAQGMCGPGRARGNGEWVDRHWSGAGRCSEAERDQLVESAVSKGREDVR